jgi:hypothetical protein
MNTLTIRRQTFALALCLALSLFGADAANAQQGAAIYAMADLTPEGAGSEGSLSSATFERLDNGGTKVTVVLIDMQPLTNYKVEVLDGSCAGGVLYSLEPMQTDDKGGGSAVTQVQAEVEFGRWFVGVSPRDDGEGPTVLCGQVNPALAGGPPLGNPPGMPSTGQSADAILWRSGLLMAILTLVTGLSFVARSIKLGRGEHS